MDKKELLEVLKSLREKSPKRKFIQKVDLILNLRNINIKNPEENVDIFVTLPHEPGKKIRVCALVGKELEEQSKIFDRVIKKEEFSKYIDNKKELRKLSREYDYFIAQANLMTEVAKVFGRTLGPKNKMPNPKSGAVVTMNSDLHDLKKKMQHTIRLKTKNEPIIKSYIGNEEMKDDDLIDNIISVHDSVVKSLPKGEGNIKNIILKLTMSPGIKV